MEPLAFRVEESQQQVVLLHSPLNSTGSSWNYSYHSLSASERCRDDGHHGTKHHWADGLVCQVVRVPAAPWFRHGSRLSVHERMRHDAVIALNILLAWGSLLWKPRWRYRAADGWAKKKHCRNGKEASSEYAGWAVPPRSGDSENLFPEPCPWCHREMVLWSECRPHPGPGLMGLSAPLAGSVYSDGRSFC